MATGTNNIAKIWDFYTYINNNGDLDNAKESLSEKYGSFTNSAAPASGWGTGLCPSKAEWLNLNSHMKKGDIVVNGTYADNRLVKFTDLTYLPRAAELAISPTTWTSPVAGGSKSISVTYSNTDYYNISSNQTWCTVPSGNQTNSSINISTSANTTTSKRTATVTFSCVGRDGVTVSKTLTVTQQGKTTITVNPTSMSFTPAGGKKTSTATPLNLSNYSVSSGADWCTVSKSGNTISVSATVNGGAARNTTVYANGTGDYDGKNVTATISVSQSSGISNINLSSNVTYGPAAQSNKTASVSRTNLTNYTAGTNVNWISLSQNGDTVTYSVNENASSARTGTIYVHGKGDYDNIARTASIYVGQKSGIPTISIDPSSDWTISSNGSSTRTISVTYTNASAYSVTANASWVTVSKSGNTVTLTASANNGADRACTVVFGVTGTYTKGFVSDSIVVSQEGVSSLTATESSWNVPVAGGTKTITGVPTNLTTYYATSSVAWAKATKSGNTITISATSANGTDRNGKVTLYGTGDSDKVYRTAEVSLSQPSGKSSISVNPTTKNLTPAAATNTATVTRTYINGYATVSSNATDWLNCTINGDTITYSTKVNKSAARTGTITITGTGTYDNTKRSCTLVVSQSLGSSSIDISSNAEYSPLAQSNKTASVSKTNIDKYTVKSNQTWCTVPSGDQTGNSITYSLTKNTGAARTATITVTGTGKYTGTSYTDSIYVSQSDGSSSLSFNSNSATLGATASASTTTAISQKNITGITLSDNATWLNTPTISGNTVTLKTANANTGSSQRSCTVTINGTGSYDEKAYSDTITVSQEAGSSSLSLSSNKTHTPAAANGTLSATPTRMGSLSVHSDKTWCTATISGNTVSYSVEKNTGGARTATVSVYGKGSIDGVARTASVYVSQSDGSSSLTVNSGYDSVSFGATATTKYSYITTKNITDVTVSDNATWLNPTISGTTVTLKTTSSNTTGSTRNATVTVSGKGTYDNKDYSDTISVSQADGTSAILLSSNQTYGPSAQSNKSATVKLTNISSYTATSSESWLTISSTGTTSLTYSCSENKTGQRTATITISGTGTVDSVKRTSSITITQNSGLPSISVNPTTMSFGKDANSKTASVSYGNVSSYTAQSNQSWCTVTQSGTTITVKCSKTNSTKSRTATVTITGTGTYVGTATCTITVTQSGAPVGLSVSPTSWTMTSNGASSKAFTTTLTNASTFNVSDLATNWLTISATSSNSFTLAASKNTSSDRSDVIYVSTVGDYAGDAVTATITISQEGISSLKASPLTHTFTPAASSSGSTVTVTNMTTWNVSSSDTSWLTATKGTGKVTISALKNPGNERVGYVYVYGTGDSDGMASTATITVKQTDGRSSLSFNSNSATVGATASASTTTTISQKNITSITLSDNATWLNTPTISGNTVTLKTANANTGSSQRNCTVTINGTGSYDNTAYSDTITVYQEAGSSSLSLASNKTHTPAAANGTLTATPTRMGSLSVYSNQNWCTATISGNTVSYNVGVNTGAARTATVSVYGKGSIDGVARTASVYVSQSSGSSSLSFNSDSVTFGATASTKYTYITQNNISNAWVDSNVNWLTSSISGNTVTLTTKSSNTTGSTRNATVTVSGNGTYDDRDYTDTISVSQTDGTSSLAFTTSNPTFAYSVSGNKTAYYSKSNLTVTETSSDADWVTIIGVESSHITYSLTTNSGPKRTATITIIGVGTIDGIERRDTFTITQNVGTPSISVSPTSWNAPLAGGSKTASVTCTRCSISDVSSDSSWLTATYSGTTVTLTASAANGTARTAVVTITGAGTYGGTDTCTISVSQSAGTSSLSVSPTSLSFANTGGTKAITISSSYFNVTSIETNAAWISASETGVTVTENTGSARGGTVTITGVGIYDGVTRTKTISVSQDSAPPTISLGSSSVSFDAVASPSTIAVTTTLTTSWSVSSNSAWCTVRKLTNSSIQISASDNNDTSSRNATVTVTATGAGGTVTATISVSQSAGRLSYSLTVTPSSVSVKQGYTTQLTATLYTYINGATSNIQDVTSECGWRSDNTTYVSVSTGTVTGVRYKSGQSVAVYAMHSSTQTSSSCSVTVTQPDSISLGSTSVSFVAKPTAYDGRYIRVTYNTSDYSFTTSGTWISVSKTTLSGSPAVSVTVSENTSTSARTGYIYFTAGDATATMTISQAAGTINYTLTLDPSSRTINYASTNGVGFTAVYTTYTNGVVTNTKRLTNGVTWSVGSYQMSGGLYYWSPYIDRNGNAYVGSYNLQGGAVTNISVTVTAQYAGLTANGTLTLSYNPNTGGENTSSSSRIGTWE